MSEELQAIHAGLQHCPGSTARHLECEWIVERLGLEGVPLLRSVLAGADRLVVPSTLYPAANANALSIPAEVMQEGLRVVEHSGYRCVEQIMVLPFVEEPVRSEIRTTSLENRIALAYAYQSLTGRIRCSS